jgi:hypothetical protein
LICPRITLKDAKGVEVGIRGSANRSDIPVPLEGNLWLKMQAVQIQPPMAPTSQKHCLKKRKELKKNAGTDLSRLFA